MLIKEADDQTAAMEELERLAAGTGTEARHAREELRVRKAGLKGEQGSAYLINFDYGNSPNWAVIHDLRLEHDGRTAQIDHLLINRWMEFFVLETKQFHAGVKITDEGEFLRWNAYKKTFEGMASPLRQNERHISVLSDVVGCIELPSRLGLRIAPTFNSLVLVAPAARIDRPAGFDTSRVIKADQLKPRIWRDLDMENPVSVLFKAATKMVSSETVKFVAEQLVALHVPKPERTASAHATGKPGAAAQRSARPGRAGKPAVVPGGKADSAVRSAAVSPVGGREGVAFAEAPSCKQCKCGHGNILHGRYGYYFLCGDCGTNTSMRFTCQPGHQPRVRKDGANFYRECAECGKSELFHTNATADAGARPAAR